MLDFELTKKNAGVVLWGDPFSLSAVRDLVGNVVDHCSLIADEESWLLNLSYEIRKAVSGDRLTRELTWHDAKVLNFGTQILWPELLAYVATLRSAMAYYPTSRAEQSAMYGLEDIVERAITSAVPRDAYAVMKALGELHVSDNDTIGEILPSRCAYFVMLPPARRLPNLLSISETFSQGYLSAHAATWGEARNSISPEVFSQFQPEGLSMPEFEW